MKAFFYRLWQCTWGILQTLLGLIVFLANVKRKHYVYHGAIVTEWSDMSSVSLGMFVFVTAEPYFYKKLEGKYSKEELSSRLLVHEYGHTIQSLILGPMYLPTIGLPSVIWLNFPGFKHWRRRTGTSYYSFFTERSANHLAERVLNRPAMGSISGKSDANKLRKLSLGKNRPRI